MRGKTGTSDRISLSLTDLFETLKKRHACRHFQPRPIPDNVLNKLAYAAHRAPTGGNAPYRFLIIVKDPIRLKMLKLASPGYFGDSTAAIVVCTDLRAAEQGLGSLGRDQCSLYDAGAAAENIVLASYALGLGASFVKSYSETAVKRILEIPEGFRTELLVSLGYPSRDEPLPSKKRKGGKTTYRDRYGQRWQAIGNGEGPLIQTHLEKQTLEQYVFGLALFLLTAARGCIGEPHMYGPLRLMDAVSRLADLYSKTDLLRLDEFLIQAKKKIDDNKFRVVVSEEEFAKFADGMIAEFTDELRRRFGK